MKKAIILVLFLIITILFPGCKRNESPLAPEELRLEGTWSEDYDPIYFYFSNDDSNMQTLEIETTEITFSAGRFLLRFPRHTKDYPNDPMSLEHKGSYTLADSVLTLLPDGNGEAMQFIIKYNVNSITLSCFSTVNPDGSVTVVHKPFFWRYLYKKTSGVFMRNTND